MEKIKLDDDDLNWENSGNAAAKPQSAKPLPPVAPAVGLPKLSAEPDEAPVMKKTPPTPAAAPAFSIPKASPAKLAVVDDEPPVIAPKIAPPSRTTVAAVPAAGELLPEAASVPKRGDAVGAYELRGAAVPAGSFVLFNAYHANLDTCRTLEFLNGGDAGSIRGFLNRARLAASADAPNLRSVIEVGEERECGYFYAVVENVAPRNLRGIAGFGRFSTAQTARMLAAAADALCAIERNGACHGALSPELILFSEDYQTLKIAGLELGTEFTLTSRSGAAYRAPECVAGGTGDIRSDLYSLGAIFYEAVTGKLPPPGKRGYVGADPREASANIAGPLAVILMRLLSLEPSARYTSAAEFAAALHAIEAECRSTGSDKISPAPGEPDVVCVAPGFLPGRTSLLPVGVEAGLLLGWRIACGILIVWLLVVAGFRVADGLRKLPVDSTVAEQKLQAAEAEAQQAHVELEKARHRAALLAEINGGNRK